MKTPHLFLVPCSMFLALCASAAEVVVYSPYDAAGFTLKAPSGTYRYDKSFTGHRAVVTVPDPTNAVLEAWTGNAAYSADAAVYGTSAGRGYPSLDLSNPSPIMPRLSFVSHPTTGDKTWLANLSGNNSNADRGLSVSDYCAELIRKVEDSDLLDDGTRKTYLDELNWVYTNQAESAKIDLATSEPTRVRIVRWVVDGQPVYRIGVEPKAVFDKKMMLSNRACLTEADVLDADALDLDWDNLKTEVVDFPGVRDLAGLSVTNVGYLVVVGDGRTGWTDEKDANSCPAILNRVVERRFTTERTVPTPVSATFEGGVARFKFRIDGDDVYGPETTSYTAFQVGVRVKGATSAVWSSGVKRLPAKMPDADVYAFSTDDAALASAITSGRSYEWVCAIYNAKFSDTPAVTDTNTWSSASLTVK